MKWATLSTALSHALGINMSGAPGGIVEVKANAAWLLFICTASQPWPVFSVALKGQPTQVFQHVVLACLLNLLYNVVWLLAWPAGHSTRCP